MVHRRDPANQVIPQGPRRRCRPTPRAGLRGQPAQRVEGARPGHPTRLNQADRQPTGVIRRLPGPIRRRRIRGGRRLDRRLDQAQTVERRHRRMTVTVGQPGPVPSRVIPHARGDRRRGGDRLGQRSQLIQRIVAPGGRPPVRVRGRRWVPRRVITDARRA